MFLDFEMDDNEDDMNKQQKKPLDYAHRILKGSLVFIVLLCGNSAALAYDLPDNERKLSAEFEAIHVASVFEILADFGKFEINTKQIGFYQTDENGEEYLTIDAKKYASYLVSIRVKNINAKRVYRALLDCFGLSSTLVDDYYLIESASAPNLAHQSCLEGQLVQ